MSKNPTGAPEASDTEKALMEMMRAICIVATAARALESDEQFPEERGALKTAVEMLYNAHSEIDADVMEARRTSQIGAGQVVQ